MGDDMAANSSNVLRVNSVEEQTDYRNAVARVLLNIQRDSGNTLQEISEAIDVSLGTISNAANKRTDLSPIYLQRLGKRYGPSALDPIARLSGGRIVPLVAEEKDALPSLSASIHRIAVAQSPDSPGGVTITHSELLAMLPDLRAAVACINSLIVKAERIAA